MSKFEFYTGKIGDISADEINQRLTQIGKIIDEEVSTEGKKPERFDRLMALQEEWQELLQDADLPEADASDDGAPAVTDPEGDQDSDTSSTDTGETAPTTEATDVPVGKVRVIADKTFQVIDKNPERTVFCVKDKSVDLHPDVAADVFKAKAGHR